MLEYPVELMMAVVVASTAFAALTGVVIGQVIESKAKIKKKERKQLLIISCGLGVLATALVISWFVSHNNWVGTLAVIIFLVQMILFWVTALTFWSEQ